jgi:pyruvate/2-oxoglutarate dehydrogenase complex dihydrolipoamide dehydrogenase (E3) component
MYDLVVIGGGAAGMGAARAARRRGARTLLVQDGPIGGECTFTGCIPSKTLVAAAAHGEPFADAMQRVATAVSIVAASESDPTFLREGIDVIHGCARFVSRRAVDVDGDRVECSRFIIATGSVPAIPSIDGLAGVDYLTNETAFTLTSLPASLAVLGGGPVGCELAQAFQRLGSRVTLVEIADRLLPREEPEASEIILEQLRDDGVDVRLGRPVERFRRVTGAGTVRARLGDDDFEADRVVVAAGRSSASQDLDLDAAGVAMDERGYVRTNDHLATTAPGIYAAGDVTGRLQFTHAADYMGRLAAGNALSRFRRERFDSSSIPWVTFTDPEVGRVGMAEAEAAQHGGRVAHLPLDEVDRAVIAGSTRGFVKLIAGPRRALGNVGGGRLLGATIVAERGGELADEVALAMRTRMFTGRLAQTVHAYPTWSSALQKAAAQFFIEYEGRRARPAGVNRNSQRPSSR